MKKNIFLPLLVLLISCSKKGDFSQVKQGMKLNDVIELVGEPKEKQDNPLFGKWYVYDTHIVVFLNDTVAKCTSMEEFQGKMKEFNKGMEELNENLKQ